MTKSIPPNFQAHNRLDSLLVLRVFACLMVVIAHCSTPRNSIIYKGYDLSWVIFSHGGVGVWIFFVVSGYLMGKAFYTQRYNLDTAGVISFWRNRVLRIFPLYYFAAIILSLFVYSELFKVENWGYLIRIFTFTYEPSVPVRFAGSFWAVSTEVQFYLIVPLVYAYLKNIVVKPKQCFAAIFLAVTAIFLVKLLFWITLNTQLHEQQSTFTKYWYIPLVTNLDLFLSGFLINVLLQYRRKDTQNFTRSRKFPKIPKSTHKIIAVVLLFSLYLFSAHHLYSQELIGLPELAGRGVRTSTTFFVLQPLTALITSFFIFTFESDVYQDFNKNKKLSFSTILENPLRIIELFGNLSFGVYLWHFSIVEKISSIFTSDVPIEAFYARLTATLVLSTLLAATTYYLVELLAARWKIYQRSVIKGQPHEA